MLAMSIGRYVGSLMPWLASSRLWPTPWLAYAWAFGVLVLPNLPFVLPLMFLLVTLTRSMLYTYLGVIVFLVLWSMSGSFNSELHSCRTRSIDHRFCGRAAPGIKRRKRAQEN